MRKGVLVLALAVALLVAGCSGGGDDGKTGSSNRPFFGGTESLRVSFMENSPPEEVLDNPLEKSAPSDKSQVMDFDIILRVENVGEQDVAAKNLKTTIGGIYPEDFGKTSALLQNSIFDKELKGNKKDPEGDRIPGSIEEIEFKKLGYQKSLQGNNEFPIQADICYRYATRAVGDFCMRQDTTKTASGVCNIKGVKQVFSSGGPVQVTSLEEAVGGTGKVILKFKIKANGPGSFFKPEPIGTTIKDGCDRGNFAEENFVKVTVSSGLDNLLTCSGFSGTPPTKELRLTGGEASVTCIQSGVAVDAVKKLNIVAEYNHLITASTSVLIKHIPTDDASIVGGFGGTPTGGAPPSGGAASGSGSGGGSTPAPPAAPAPPTQR